MRRIAIGSLFNAAACWTAKSQWEEMMRLYVLAASAALLFAITSAHAQQFDGAWKGQAGQWTVSLTVSGAKARLYMTCGGADFNGDIPIGADGTINTYVTTGSFRRQITGKLPSFTVPPGGTCQGGTATLTR